MCPTCVRWWPPPRREMAYAFTDSSWTARRSRHCWCCGRLKPAISCFRNVARGLGLLRSYLVWKDANGRCAETRSPARQPIHGSEHREAPLVRGNPGAPRVRLGPQSAIVLGEVRRLLVGCRRRSGETRTTPAQAVYDELTERVTSPGMRVLLVSDFYPPTPGGLEAHVRRLAEALLRRGHDVAVVSGTAHPDLLPGDASFHCASTTLSSVPGLYHNKGLQFPTPFPDPMFRQTVRQVAESWRPDIIHAHGWCAFSSYWTGVPPLIVTIHDHGLCCPKQTLMRAGKECSTGIGPRCITCSGDQSVVKRIPLAAAMHWSVPKLAAHASKFIAVSYSVAERASEGGVPKLRLL